jgi:hypothetical protein
MKRTLLAVLMMVGVLALPAWGQNQQPQQSQTDGNDQDHGVARISLLNGDVSVKRGDTGETVAAELNAPVVALDHVLTGQGSRAEVQFDWANMIRLGPESEVRIGELRDNSFLIQVAEGTTTFRVLRDSSAQVEISTPTVSVRPTQKGTYRVTVRSDGSTQITVRSGQAEIFSPRGTETLTSGKTMEARGTVSDPEYMINNAIPHDDWDTWNENRDKDMEKTQSYKYASPDQYGADDLDGYGRWAYDSPYGYVWVPNVAAGWAPYRVGRWSWINYYGWTWVSGDPWGWAPYHYGSWYASPYGWAWYPGIIGPRYYWRPAVVGFFGWGGIGVSVGVGFGAGWGWGYVGWVPLAPYEIYHPWYGHGYYNTAVVNHTTIVNNTNITNVYRNARTYNGRNGVTSVQSNNFGRGSVNGNNFVHANSSDLSRTGQVQGAMPFQQSRESRQFSNRTPGSDTLARAGRQQNTQFANFTRSAPAVRSGQTSAAPGGNGFRATSADTSRASGSFSNSQANTSQQNAGGWRRFDPSTNANRTGVDRGTNNFANSPQVSNPSGFRQQSNNGRQFSNSGTLNSQATQSGNARSANPVQINPPIVRSRNGSNGFSNTPNANSAPQRYATPNTNSAPQRYAMPSQSFNGGQSAPRYSAPSYGGGHASAPAPRMSAPSGGGGSHSSGGGGGSHGGGGGGGHHR